MRFLISYVNEVADAATAESNDGMNCPVVWTMPRGVGALRHGDKIQCSTTRSAGPICLSGVGLRRLLLASAGHEGRDDLYKAMTLDLETGEYEEMFELEYAVGCRR